MKKNNFYSSAFLSFILGFLILLGTKNQEIIINPNQTQPDYLKIESPLSEPEINPEIQEKKEIKIEIFTQWDCPACKSFGLNVVPKLREKYENQEDIMFNIHVVPREEWAPALYTKCAEEQGKFWEMFNFLYTEYLDKIEDRLNEIEIDREKWNACLNSPEIKEKIADEAREIAPRGIKVYPTTFINEYKLVGDQPIENIEKIIRTIHNFN